MHIGFLFNHYAGHQLLHGAPIAFELARRHPDHLVTIFVSSAALRDIALRIGTRYPGSTPKIELLVPPAAARLVDPLVRPFAFLNKQAVLRHHAGRFHDLDILVVPEKTSLALKRMPGLSHLRFVYTHHGAGDRAEAFYPELSQFDLVLTPGPKIHQRLIASGLVRPDRLAMVGYPKFSVAGCLSAAPPRLVEERRTVLYNPHYSVHESSWAKMGRRVLDYFRDSDRYNLIFAPHVLLYGRWLRHRARPLGRWRGVPHMHLDTGSDALIDMTYVQMADLYLGDVSSQIYEFLIRPRPVLFLDARGIANWRENESFEMWRAGEVLTDVAELGQALERAYADHDRYIDEQRAIFSHTFDENGTAPEVRAADAIVARLASG